MRNSAGLELENRHIFKSPSSLVVDLHCVNSCRFVL
jgi:hypothetical protein